MRILIVCSGNSGRISPFIIEQADSLKELGVDIDYFLIQGKGILGYLKNYFKYRRKINQFHPDIVHAHYGLSGLLACLQRKLPVVVTLHGSDATILWVRLLSQITIWLASKTIFVSDTFRKRFWIRDAYVIPCGVDTLTFKPLDRDICRDKLGLTDTKVIILFSSSFNNRVKNFPLALAALNQLRRKDETKIIELKGYTREQVALLMNAANLCLMTSFSEGSPQFIKEAMSSNTPIVSVAVGDVINNLEGIDGCYISSYNPDEIAKKIELAIDFSMTEYKTGAREHLSEKGLEINTVAQKIVLLYNQILHLQK